MPLYDYRCTECGAVREVLVRDAGLPVQHDHTYDEVHIGQVFFGYSERPLIPELHPMERMIGAPRLPADGKYSFNDGKKVASGDS